MGLFSIFCIPQFSLLLLHIFAYFHVLVTSLQTSQATSSILRFLPKFTDFFNFNFSAILKF